MCIKADYYGIELVRCRLCAYVFGVPAVKKTTLSFLLHYNSCIFIFVVLQTMSDLMSHDMLRPTVSYQQQFSVLSVKRYVIECMDGVNSVCFTVLFFTVFVFISFFWSKSTDVKTFVFHLQTNICFCSVLFHDLDQPLNSGDEASQPNDVKQLQRRERPDGTTCRPSEESGIFGHGDDAAEGGVDVPEVVLQRRHLLCILLCGEDL